MQQTLELDPAIRNWVILPLTIVIMLVGVCRHYVSLLIKSEEKAELETASQMQTLQRAQRLRGSSHFLRPSAWLQRKVYFTKKGGALKSSHLSGPKNPMMDPKNPGGGMMNMMKNNMLFMIPNMGMMAWISFFFPGFITLKVPFQPGIPQPVAQRVRNGPWPNVPREPRLMPSRQKHNPIANCIHDPIPANNHAQPDAQLYPHQHATPSPPETSSAPTCSILPCPALTLCSTRKHPIAALEPQKGSVNKF